MRCHHGVFVGTLDQAMELVGADDSELITIGAAGIVTFDNLEDREQYEGRVLDEARMIKRRRNPEKYAAMVDRNREIARAKLGTRYKVKKADEAKETI